MRAALRNAVVCLMCALTAAGCSIGRLDDSVLLSGDIAPEKCTRYKLKLGYNNQNHPPVFVPDGSEAISCVKGTVTDHYPGLRLRIGDKFTYRPLTFGYGVYKSSAFRDQRPPSGRDETIALRHIGKDVYLHDEEERFLMAIQALARVENYGDDSSTSGESTREIARRFSDPSTARALWNAMPNALRLINVHGPADKGARWQLTVNMKTLCEAFNDNDLFEAAYGGGKKVCSNDRYVPIDFGLTGFRYPAEAAAFFVEKDPTKNTYYDKRRLTGTFGFIDVVLGGVSMRNPGYPEWKWSLAEWQASGLCRTLAGDASESVVIRMIKLKDSWPGSWTTVIHSKEPGSPEPTHKVEIKYTPGGKAAPRRVLHELSEGYPYPYRIADSDLKKILAKDLVGIEWGLQPGNDKPWLAREWLGSVTQRCVLY